MAIKIENEHTLMAAMKNGINLFVGAGFSIYAKDAKERNLPIGRDLLKELHGMFTKGTVVNDLPTFCAIAERENPDRLRNYLTERFTVNSFDPAYNNLNLINVKGVYTTNIDNLVPQIIQQNKNKYVHNQKSNGECIDSRGVNYLPIHGNVEDEESPYIFSVSSLATIFNDSSRIMNYLTIAMEKYPTLFIGYGMNDNSVIQALTSQPSFYDIQKERWAVLNNPDESTIEYFKSFDFKIIIADTKEFLDAIIDLCPDNTNVEESQVVETERLLAKYIVPKDTRELPKRPIIEYFRGLPPLWTDIIGNRIKRTSFYDIILDSVNNPSKNTIITGAPVSGKTTLARQICSVASFDGYKLYIEKLTIGLAKYIGKVIGNQRALICIESFTDDINAFFELANLPNVQLVGVDRTHSFGAVDHRFPSEVYDVINVTEIPESDLRSVHATLPVDAKKDHFKLVKNNKDSSKNTIFEFVLKNIKGQTIKSRYLQVIRDLEQEEPDLAQFLILCAYMSACNVPLSMEVAYSYFSDLHYSEVLKLSKRLSDYLTDRSAKEMYEDSVTELYEFRSLYIADVILKGASPKMVRSVIDGIIDNVGTYTICNYNTFRRKAFDKELIMHLYPNWREGKDFYEKAFLFDFRNPYILQQGALYLSDNRQYDLAFEWIDRAKNMTSDKYFSIRNSHAIILFEANYYAKTQEAQIQLDKSMDILNKCFNDDKRKIFHALTYSKQAIRYHKKFPGEKSYEYLRKAEQWLRQEEGNNVWKYEIRNMKKDIEKAMGTAI